MKWKTVVFKAINDGTSDKLLLETMGDMQCILDFVKESEPTMYWSFKGAATHGVTGSSNAILQGDDDKYSFAYE